MNSKDCAFCGKQLELGDDEEEYHLWTHPGMSFEEGQLACLECVNGSPGAQHESLYGKSEEGR